MELSSDPRANVNASPQPVERPADAEHDCPSEGTLVYRGVFGAPGFGESWDCTACQRGWARLGGTFHPVEDEAHILTEADVR